MPVVCLKLVDLSLNQKQLCDTKHGNVSYECIIVINFNNNDNCLLLFASSCLILHNECMNNEYDCILVFEVFLFSGSGAHSLLM